jgi:hypothetical protein
MAYVTRPAQIPSDLGFPAKEAVKQPARVEPEKKKKRKPRKKSPIKKLTRKLFKTSISRKKKQGRKLPWKV